MQKTVLVCLAFIWTGICCTIRASESPNSELIPFLFQDDIHKFEMIKNYYEFKETFYKRPALKVVKSWFDFGLPTLTTFSFYRGWKKKSMLQIGLSGALGLLTLKYYTDWRLPVQAWEKKNKKCVTKLVDCAQKLKNEDQYPKSPKSTLHNYLLNKAFFQMLIKNEKDSSEIAPFKRILNTKLEPINNAVRLAISENKKITPQAIKNLQMLSIQKIEAVETELKKNSLTKSD